MDSASMADQIPTEIFCTCGLSKAILEEIELSSHCTTLRKSRTLGLVHSSRWFFLYCKAVIQSGLIGESKIGKEGRNTVFFTAVDLLKEPQRDEPCDVKGPRVVIRKCTTMQFIGSS